MKEEGSKVLTALKGPGYSMAELEYLGPKQAPIHFYYQFSLILVYHQQIYHLIEEPQREERLEQKNSTIYHRHHLKQQEKIHRQML